MGSMIATSTASHLRRGEPDDSRAAFDVLMEAARDLTARQGIDWNPKPDEFWTQSESFYRHLATHAAEWWLAEDPASGELLGYARSIQRGGLMELSEFFVRPAHQSAGIGRQLLERAFPPGRGDVRVIVATTDVRALRSYYRAGTVARFPIATLEGVPQRTHDDRELLAIRAGKEDIAALASLEAAVLEFPRDADDFRWLLHAREAYLYERDARRVGFAFVSATGSGPMVALEAADQVSILRHVEGRAAELGGGRLGLEVPMVNEVAVRHLLDRGFKIDPFLTILMSSRPFGQFDRFIGFAPPLVL
jgi:GNAT superfamily N-acetyltransferase